MGQSVSCCSHSRVFHWTGEEHDPCTQCECGDYRKMELNEITSKAGNVWYLANNGKVTIWFREVGDRDYYVGGGEIETKPGRDEQNRWFDKRNSAAPVQSGLSGMKVVAIANTQESAVSPTNPIKERLKRLYEELGEILKVL